MFCVIQEIITKRENPPGFSKRLEVTHYTTYAEDGTEQIKWGYVYSDECFERPVKKSYKVSVHQSYRDKDGKPRKKEFVLFTVKYYDLATGEFDTYNWDAEKIEKVATNLYGASVITYSSIARNRIKLIEKMGITHYPVCIAKTQYSFSADPKIYGAVNNFEFHIKDIVINNGAEMIVAIAGEILRMPGLPKEPQALHIDIVDGEIEGLS